jgi:DNA-binding winged helix-turn-helix (wHTH) protein/tetratricopeptide (TPR) repeat protein
MSASVFDPPEGTRDDNGNPSRADLTESFFLGDWRIEPANRCARNGNSEVKIDPRNLRVLQILVERRGQIISQREIEAVAWEGVVVTSDSLYQSIRQLRQAFGDTKPPAPAKYIETIPRQGYRLVAEVRSAASTPSASAGTIDGAGASSCLHTRPISWVIWLLACACTLMACVLIFFWPYSGMAVDSIQAGSRMSTDAQSLRALAVMALQNGKAGESLSLLERALQTQISRTGERNQIVVDLLFDLANTQYWMNDDVAALTTARRARSILDEVAPNSSPERVVSLNIFAAILIGTGEYGEADEAIRQSVDLAYGLYGIGHPATFQPLSVLATLRHSQGRLAEAESVSRKALTAAIDTRGADDFRAAYEGAQLSIILIDMGRFAEAEREARISVQALTRSGSQNHPYLGSAKHVLAEALVKLGRLDEAQQLLREEIATLTRESAANWRVGRAAGAFAEVLLHRGDVSGAETYLLLANSKLAGAKGWPADRELRNLQRRRIQLDALRSASAPDRVISATTAVTDNTWEK